LKGTDKTPTTNFEVDKSAQRRDDDSVDVRERVTIKLPRDLERALIEDSKRRGKDLREQLPTAILYGLRLYVAAYISDFKRPDAP